MWDDEATEGDRAHLARAGCVDCKAKFSLAEVRVLEQLRCTHCGSSRLWYEWIEPLRRGLGVYYFNAVPGLRYYGMSAFFGGEPISDTK